MTDQENEENIRRNKDDKDKEKTGGRIYNQ